MWGGRIPNAVSAESISFVLFSEEVGWMLLSPAARRCSWCDLPFTLPTSPSAKALTLKPVPRLCPLAMCKHPITLCLLGTLHTVPGAPVRRPFREASNNFSKGSSKTALKSEHSWCHGTALRGQKINGQGWTLART